MSSWCEHESYGDDAKPNQKTGTNTEGEHKVTMIMNLKKHFDVGESVRLQPPNQTDMRDAVREANCMSVPRSSYVIAVFPQISFP